MLVFATFIVVPPIQLAQFIFAMFIVEGSYRKDMLLAEHIVMTVYSSSVILAADK
jgi:hypothetical protein